MTTSVSTVDTVRQFYDGCAAGDFAAASQVLDDDLVIHEPAGLPYGGEYHGPAGFEELMGRIVDQFEPSVVSLEYLDAENPVVVRLVGRFTARSSGQSVDMKVVELYTVRAGRIAEIDVYYQDPAAIVALANG